ncbi:S8 family serine peptidase [Actinokineospora sp. NBRC 105648]|uniref:S8 family serine peptidase n=1 Tax=Actinokineospora sp. NBRC 105648 TaxID=3032206 RepID=UPI0024A4F81E|nr:S8 family serine peptidase [Actinokineospora sp. NBRC 105648]GLZ41832.1 serine protease [Actinokineospora sp. NBRC 105648]
MAAATVVLGTVLSGVQLAPAQAAPPAPEPVVGRSVTLLTGDRVVVDALGHRSIRPGPSRERTAFSHYERDGHQFVVPVDALAAITDGKVDERLFDITTLLDSGYDDAHGAGLPLIVTYDPGLAPVALAGTVTTANLAAVNGSAVTASRDGSAWRAVGTPGVHRIWLDGARKAQLDRSAAQIGAPAAWQAGYTGAGVTVAVLDTGVDETHPDLATREVAEHNFSDAPDTVDRVGHGTTVASILAGTGARYRGIASGARLLDGKVFDDNGLSRDSWIIAGMQWAVEQDAKVVNLSLGAADLPGADPLEEAVNTLSAQHGTLFVVAAGNTGPNPGTITSPGSAEAALTVGAVDRADKIASFSGRGPRIGDAGAKPDITAPGVGIVAARSSASPGDGLYAADTGTSMAAPHVAGAAALLAQQHPDWTGEQLKAVLMASAKPGVSQTIYQEGLGRVDLATAIKQTLATSPPSVHLGVQQLPDTSGRTHAKTVTYRNTGTEPQTLDLSSIMYGPDGKLSTLVTVTPARLVVPAGGTATATYTADAATATLQGIYAGVVIARGPGQFVRTPVVFLRSEQTFEITVRQLGLDGHPAIASQAGFTSTTTGRQWGVPASGRLRLPKGDYAVSALLTGDNLSWLYQPKLTVTGDTEVVLDYRLAKPIDIKPPVDARGYFLDVAVSYGLASVGFTIADVTRLATAGLGDPVPGSDFTARFHTQWLTDDATFYGLAWFVHGAMPTGFTKRPSKRELAHVHADLRPTHPAQPALRGEFPYPVEGKLPDPFVANDTITLPRVREEYYTTEDQGTLWNTQLVQLQPDGQTVESTVLSPMRHYRSGRTYEETFNHGVYGPVFPALPKEQSWVSRIGDYVHAYIPLFGDGNGNAGTSAMATTATTLYLDDKKIGESTAPPPVDFAVPAPEGNYRLVADATRAPGTADVSTRVTASWSFRSAHTDTLTPLPLSTIRITPNLDKANATPKGRFFAVPFSLQAQGSSDLRPAKTLSVEVSYDSGTTWQKAPVFGGTAFLCHPNKAGTVSLRAKATDRTGQALELTVIDAYKLV